MTLVTKYQWQDKQWILQLQRNKAINKLCYKIERWSVEFEVCFAPIMLNGLPRSYQGHCNKVILPSCKISLSGPCNNLRAEWELWRKICEWVMAITQTVWFIYYMKFEGHNISITHILCKELVKVAITHIEALFLRLFSTGMGYSNSTLCTVNVQCISIISFLGYFFKEFWRSKKCIFLSHRHPKIID